MNNWRSDETKQSLWGVDSHQIGHYKVRGTSKYQAGPAEHKAILQLCELCETCLLSSFPSLDQPTPDAGGGLESETTLAWGGSDGSNENHLSFLGFLFAAQLGVVTKFNFKSSLEFCILNASGHSTFWTKQDSIWWLKEL